MTGITGRENQLFFQEFGDQIDALTRRTDELLDGRLPRIRAIATPGEPAKLVEGSHTADSAMQNMLRHTGVKVGGEIAEHYASTLDKVSRHTANLMIDATLELSEIGRGISAAGMLLRMSELADYIPPVRYEYATWTQTSLRVAGGILAVCSATHLEARRQDEDNAKYDIVVDDNTTRQTLTVSKADGIPFRATFAVETSHDFLEGQCVKVMGLDTARSLLNGEESDDSSIEERIVAFLAERTPVDADSYALQQLSVMAARAYQRALKVRQVREELITHVDLPNQRALDNFCWLLKAQPL